MNLPDDPKLLQAKAWIGDAVLALCIREWLLHQDGRVSSAKFENLTSNAFLNTLGNPTKVEAQIGMLYQSEGLEAARGWIKDQIIPIFLKQERNRTRR
jgi:23S rRNA maturation mini-RNase III